LFIGMASLGPREKWGMSRNSSAASKDAGEIVVGLPSALDQLLRTQVATETEIRSREYEMPRPLAASSRLGLRPRATRRLWRGRTPPAEYGGRHIRILACLAFFEHA
jgi:hypothetical protein